MASDLRFSYSSLYLGHHKTAPSGPQIPQLHMEGTHGIRYPEKNRGHTASDLGFSYLSLYQDPLSNDPGTFQFSTEGAFGISIILPEAGLHPSSGKAKLTSGPILENSQFLGGY